MFDLFHEADNVDPTLVEAMLERIHRELSSDFLTSRYVLPYEAARESFQPSITRGNLFEVQEELRRFVEHVEVRVYTMPSSWGEVSWPESLVREGGERLWWDLGGWRAISLEIESKGIRGLLDRGVKIMRQQALDAHIEIGIYGSMKDLGASNRARLAQRYLEEYGKRLSHAELTHYVMFEVYWLEILREHANVSMSAALRAFNASRGVE